MSPSLRTASAVAVLISGLVVLAGIQFGDRSDLPVEPPAVVVPSTVTQQPEPAVEGLAPEVRRVLESAGKLEQLSFDQLSMFRPEVARVLVQYGANLIVAERSGAKS